LHAKDSALKRLNIPLLNIAKAIEQDAYLTLSWANQVYSVPEIKKFANSKELLAFEEESNKKASKLRNLPNGEIEGEYYQDIDLGLDEDRDGSLVESPERRFFKMGSEQFPLENIKWDGKITIKAKSIISPNPELEKQRKLELYNVVSPVVQQMASLWYQHVDPKTGEMYTPEGGKEVAIALYHPLNEILDINDENPENWVFDDLLQAVNNPEILQKEKEEIAAAEQEKPENSLFVDQNSLEEGGMPGMPATPGASNTIVAPSSISNPLKQAMGAMKGAETKAMGSLPL